jgi:hypothetical protein
LFILCDSPNARNSAAVLREMELVKSMAREGKVVETIDLGRDLETEIHKVIRLSKRATAFLSYASADRVNAELQTISLGVDQISERHDFDFLRQRVSFCAGIDDAQFVEFEVG